MEKAQYHVLQLTWSHIYRYVRVTERYTETLHVKKTADLVAVSLQRLQLLNYSSLEKTAF